jgi:hypothetical protein
MTRRAALAEAAAFTILPAALVRGYAANDKLNIGVIGLGRGNADAKEFSDIGQNIAALCEVDSLILEKRAAAYPQARKYTDFRKMIEKEKLDGVVVATPDHSHAYISVWAMKHGLHVYCEKPLTQTVHEARVMAKVMAETKMITQMGTGSTAYPGNLRTMELIQSGALGEIVEVHVVTDRPIWPQGHDSLSIEDPVPSTLDWDMWLGPAPHRPFVAKWPEGHAVYSPERKRQFSSEGCVYHRHNWRGWTEFGSGAIGDIAAHSMNVIFMALDLGPPSAVEVIRTSGMKKEMYPEWTVMRYSWPQRGVHPPLDIYWYDGGQQPPESISKRPPRPAQQAGAAARPLRQGAGPVTWIGTKGSLPQGLGPFQGQKPDPYEQPAPKDWGRETVFKDWVAGVRNGKQPSCNFGFAGPFTEAYQLGNIALRVGHRIEWDALAFRITNCREANQYLRRQQYRRGYDLKEIAGSAFNV